MLKVYNNTVKGLRASVDAATQFYTNVLGLKLSDRSGDILAFFHGVHGSDHHMVAFAKADKPGFHHASWIELFSLHSGSLRQLVRVRLRHRLHTRIHGLDKPGSRCGR